MLSIILSGNAGIFNYLFVFFNKIFNRFGYEIKFGKLLRKSLKAKEDIDYISIHERKLDLNYDVSSRSKKILNDFK